MNLSRFKKPFITFNFVKRRLYLGPKATFSLIKPPRPPPSRVPHLCRSWLPVSGRYPPHGPVPSILLCSFLSLSALPVRSRACCMAQRSLLTTCSLSTSNPPPTPPLPPKHPPPPCKNNYHGCKDPQMMSQLSLVLSALAATDREGEWGGETGGKTLEPGVVGLGGGS